MVVEEASAIYIMLSSSEFLQEFLSQNQKEIIHILTVTWELNRFYFVTLLYL